MQKKILVVECAESFTHTPLTSGQWSVLKGKWSMREVGVLVGRRFTESVECLGRQQREVKEELGPHRPAEHLHCVLLHPISKHTVFEHFLYCQKDLRNHTWLACVLSGGSWIGRA